MLQLKHEWLGVDVPLVDFSDEGSRGVVLMLHRVSERRLRGIPNNENLKVSPSYLQKVIDKYRRAGYQFVSVEDVHTFLTTNTFPDVPFVCFTLDDGYLDNYTNAFPIFQKNNVPFCIFVSTDIIDKKTCMWWYAVEHLIQSNRSITVGDATYDCSSFQARWDTFRLLREKILSLPQDNLVEELDKLFAAYAIDWLKPVRELSMDWAQVEELSRCPLCTIGGHTVSHKSLSGLSPEGMEREIAEGNRILAEHIQQPIRHFSYPYGSKNEVGEREVQFVERDVALQTAFISDGGVLKASQSSPYTIPRIMLQ